MDFLPMWAFVTSCIARLENHGVLSYDLANGDTFHCAVSKIYILGSYHVHGGGCQFSKILNIYLKTQLVSMATNTIRFVDLFFVIVVFLLEGRGSLPFHDSVQSLNNCSLSVSWPV